MRKITSLFAASVLTVAAHAQIAQVSEFTGSLNESFETFTTQAYITAPNLTIMGGGASLSATNGYVVADNIWGLAGKGAAHPTSGSYLYGVNDQVHSMNLSFNSPVRAFGGFFNTNGANGNSVTFVFRDAAGTPIGLPQVLSAPTTNVSAFMGFSSTVPIKSVSVSGGFLAADDLRANPVPEPTSMAALSLGVLGILRRRKRA